MPKEVIGDVEVRWSRGSKDETIDIVIPGSYLFPPWNSPYEEPEYMKALRERGYKIVVTTEQASQFAKVLQKAVRQIEEPFAKAGVVSVGEILISKDLNTFIMGRRGSLWSAWEAELNNFSDPDGMSREEALSFIKHVEDREPDWFSQARVQFVEDRIIRRGGEQ